MLALLGLGTVLDKLGQETWFLNLICCYSGSHSYEVRFWSASILLAL